MPASAAIPPARPPMGIELPLLGAPNSFDLFCFGRGIIRSGWHARSKRRQKQVRIGRQDTGRRGSPTPEAVTERIPRLGRSILIRRKRTARPMYPNRRQTLPDYPRRVCPNIAPACCQRHLCPRQLPTQASPALAGRLRQEKKPNRRNDDRPNCDDHLLEASPERKELPTSSKVLLDR